MPLSALGGMALGAWLMLSAPSIVGTAASIYDETFQVLSMSGQVVQVEGDAVQINIRGEKHRGTECQLLKVYGYGVDGDGTMHSANATRIDMAETGIGLAAGRYDIGVWSIRPVRPDARSVRVYTDHNCIGRVIKTKIADVALP
jgi:hypothetical protein